MSVVALGVNHRTADVALLERLAVPEPDLPKALTEISRLEHVLEGVILSTCNRVEVYAHVSRFHPGLQELMGWVAGRGDIHPQDLEPVHYSYYDEGAAAHLFGVAAGLDSMVVGEHQIAGQVRQAGLAAQEEGTAGRVLHKLFRSAVRASRRVRSETGIGREASSIVDVGLDLAAEAVPGGLGGRTTLILGAGTVGSLAGTRLATEGSDPILIWNRTGARARRLAERTGGRVVQDVAGALAAAELVVCTTGVSTPLVDAELLDRILTRREGPPVLLDLGVPRNVDPACADLPGVTVIDIESVREVTAGTGGGDALEEARALVAEEAGRFSAWMRAVEVEPTIKALRHRAHAVREGELQRLSSRLGDLDDRQRAAVEALAHGIVNTLLHEPTVRLKGLADRGGAEHYANALRELFDLEE